jgi:hypothetical protein
LRWHGVVTVQASRLRGRLTGDEGNVELTGRFAARRQTGLMSGIPEKLNKLPGVSRFTGTLAEKLDTWEVCVQFKLTFGGTDLEFNVRSRAVVKVSATRSGRALAWPRVDCAELLAEVERITWGAEESIAQLAEQIDSMQAAGRPADLLSCHWTTAILWLAIGQDDHARDAVRAGQGSLHDNLGRIDVHRDLDKLGQRLIEGLRVADLRQKAASVADLIGEARGERP